MSVPNISNNYPNDLGFPLQENSFWTGKVVTKVHEVTSCVVSSISSIAQFILSSCICVGTLGLYTLNDLKDYFSIKGSLEDKDRSAAFSSRDDMEEKSPDIVLKEAKSNLKRHESKISIDSTTFRRLRLPQSSNCSSLYPNLGDNTLFKLSTHQKTPEERLAEMEKSVIDKGR